MQNVAVCIAYSFVVDKVVIKESYYYYYYFSVVCLPVCLCYVKGRD